MKVKAARSDKGWLDRKLASLKLRKGFEEESQKLAVGEHRDDVSCLVSAKCNAPYKLARLSPQGAAWLILECARRTSTT